MFYNNNYPTYQPDFARSNPMGFNSLGRQIIRVNGKDGAMTLQMGPNESSLLLDNNEPIVWLVQTDGAGYKTITPYSITPYKSKEEEVKQDLEERITRLENIIDGKSYNSNVKRKTKSNESTNESDNND